MNSRSIYRTLLNRPGLITIAWATAQQLTVAASTYFIVAAIRQATGGSYEGAIGYATAFAASLILVYIPATCAVVWWQKWRYVSFTAFIERFIEANGGKSTWSHERDKKQHESWLTNESSVVYEDGTRVLFDLYQILISTLLNIAVIALAIDGWISGWYIAAGVILLVGRFAFRERIARASQKMQNSRRDLSTTMLNAWENIFVGNEQNLTNWRQGFHHATDSAARAAVQYDRTCTVISSATVSVALVVIATGNALYLKDHQGNLSALAALLVTLPRQLQVVQNIFGFFGFLLSWEGVASQFRELDGLLRLSATPKNLSPYISFSEITIDDSDQVHKVSSLIEAADLFRAKKAGRFTIRGKNGAGKSTLLSSLAESTGKNSFMLPSRYVGLAFDRKDLVSLSDGNRMLALFEEVRNFSDVKYILLDEWDANLDAANVERVNSAIEALAADRIVIESRHRA